MKTQIIHAYLDPDASIIWYKNSGACKYSLLGLPPISDISCVSSDVKVKITIEEEI